MTSIPSTRDAATSPRRDREDVAWTRGEPSGPGGRAASTDESAGPLRAGVVGGGYLGVATAAGLLLRGVHVTLAEASDARRAPLAEGRLPIHEPGIEDLLRCQLASGRLTIRAELDVGPYDVVAICVATPIDDAGQEDDSHLRSALASVRPALQQGAALAVRSTVALGTTERLILDFGLHAPRVFTAPEFLRQGSALEDIVRPSRVVIGAAADASAEHLARIVRLFAVEGAPTYVVSYAEAELIKSGANGFLATKLAFANDLAQLCDALGADARRVLAAIAADPRIGTGHFVAGFGFGGSCLPKDLRSLAARAEAAGVPMPLARAALPSSARHLRALADRVRETCGGDLTGRTVALLGLSFKVGTDDTRGSCALELAALLRRDGATIVGYDPLAVLHAASPPLRRAESLDDALRGCDVAVLTTEWPNIVDALRRRDANARPTVIDGRRAL